MPARPESARLRRPCAYGRPGTETDWQPATLRPCAGYNDVNMAVTLEAPSGTPEARVTLRTMRRWARTGKPVPVLTCYDATTARWLVAGGVQCLLVGDTAAQVLLGHDTTLPATMPFMLEITAAVRRVGLGRSRTQPRRAKPRRGVKRLSYMSQLVLKAR